VNILKKLIILFLSMTYAYSVHAINDHPQGIIVDGSLTGTSSIELTGPEYQIKAKYGRLEQTNLFHSFSQFNLHSGERAVFSGPESVQNIISRVSGQHISWIDGSIESSIPNANFYLLNPSGVIFGKNAILDIDGSFYVSTADYLTLGNHGVFNTNGLLDFDILTSEAPAAFGFIEPSMTSIVFKGGEKTNATPELGIHVSEGQRISVIAGNIHMKGSWYQTQLIDDYGNLVFKPVLDEWGWPVYEIQTDENGEPIYDQWGLPIYLLDEKGNQIPVLALDENNNPIPVMETVYPATLLASGGQIQLLTSGPETEISIDPDPLHDENLEGVIHISEKAEINVSGQGGGDIIIKGGQFFLDHSNLRSETFGNSDGGKIDIHANNVNLRRGAHISANIYGTGKGSDIQIQATSNITAELQSDIDSCTTTISALSEHYLIDNETGDCGRIHLASKMILFKDDAQIASSQKGKDAAISLEADTVSFIESAQIRSIRYGSENAGISIIANEMIEFNAAELNVYSDQNGNSQSADPGNIYLKANDILFSEKACISYETHGNAEDITIEGNTISFIDGSYIETIARKTGLASHIKLLAQTSLLFSGKKDLHDQPVQSSYISMQANDQAHLPSLLLDAQNISFMNWAYIASENNSTGKGGNVTLKADGSISFISNVHNYSFGIGSSNGVELLIYGETGIRLTTKSLAKNAGDAGKLLLEAENIFFVDGAFIKANTMGNGMGGDVTLIASQHVLFDGESQWFDNAPTANDNPWNTKIDITSSGENRNSGDSGKLIIDANSIEFSNGAMINTESLGTGNGGMIQLNARDTISFWGEDDDSSVSAIHASTKYHEVGAGDAGSIEIHAKRFLLSKGAFINSSSYGEGNGGSIHVVADKISLSGVDRNGNPSNIYSGSESTSLLPGDGGTIIFSAKNISLSSQAYLSTASKGNGKAGNIELHADSIYLDNLSAIRSGSESENYYVVENKSAIDAKFILSGDRISVSETNKMLVFTGKISGGAVRFIRYYEVDTLDALPPSGLISEGDMAVVSDDGTGNQADYICILDPEFNIPMWIRFNPDNVTTFPDMTEMNQINNTTVPENEVPPYANGIVKVRDDGYGKEAIFVCSSKQNQICFPPHYYLNIMRIGHFNLDHRSQLTEISKQLALENGDHFTIHTDSSEYVFYNGAFIKLNSTVHVMDSKEGIFDLIQAQTGDFVSTSDNGKNYIYSGKNWLTPRQTDLIVSDIAAMHNLAAESGDIVYVVNTDNEKNPGNFLFADNQWIPFAKGKGNDIQIEGKNLVMNHSSISTSTFGHGNAANISLNVDNIQLDANASLQSESTATKFGGCAGTIQIHSKNAVRLIGNSALSTKTLDAGGGKVFVDAEKSISLLNGEITSSVKQGAGEGGDVNLRSAFMLMNHAKITANADEGDGGAIFITADYFIKSADSPIEATSNRGNDGTVKIDAPDINITKGLIALPSTLLNASQWLRTPCTNRTGQESSHFIIKGRDAVSEKYDDFLSSPPSRIAR
jgi:filamentous hemagglutinin family protein